MAFSAKWKDRFALVGALPWIGLYYHLAAVGLGMTIDVLVGLASGGSFTWPVTTWLLAPWR